jgi:small subunit ribosomal protein S6
MPRYELMYILASSVSDDQVPQTAQGIEQFVTDNKGTEITHEQLGKKKLAYPIKKTRNGHYGVITFTAAGNDVNLLDAKLRTQKATVIRHIIVNIDEHLERLEKDKEAQAKMNRNRPPEAIAADKAKDAETPAPGTQPREAKPARETAKPKEVKPKTVVTEAVLEEEIEKALNEDITK